MKAVQLEILPGRLAVCRLPVEQETPAWAWSGAVQAVTRTADELSIVCAEEHVPEIVKAERGWRVLRVCGPLDFSLVGIMADLTGALARAEISLFAISTYDTDYLLVKEEKLSAAKAALEDAGFSVKED